MIQWIFHLFCLRHSLKPLIYCSNTHTHTHWEVSAWLQKNIIGWNKTLHKVNRQNALWDYKHCYWSLKYHVFDAAFWTKGHSILLLAPTNKMSKYCYTVYNLFSSITTSYRCMDMIQNIVLYIKMIYEWTDFVFRKALNLPLTMPKQFWTLCSAMCLQISSINCLVILSYCMAKQCRPKKSQAGWPCVLNSWQALVFILKFADDEN